MRLKIAVVALFLLVACVAPCVSFATPVAVTLKFTSDPGGQVYPYDFSITPPSGPAATNVPLSCLNDSVTVNVNESWDASADNLWTDVVDAGGTLASRSTVVGGMTVGELEADAYLDALYGTSAGTDTEIQDAIWDILFPTGTHNVALDSTAQGLYNTAYEYEIGTLSETSAFYSQFTYYYATSWGAPNQDDKSGDMPQQFLGYTPTPVTPEPSSLILMGTGLLSAVGAARRKFKKA